MADESKLDREGKHQQKKAFLEYLKADLKKVEGQLKAGFTLEFNDRED